MASRIRTHIIYGPLAGFGGAAFDSPAWQPRVDLYEMELALLIQIEAPGLAVDDLQLHFERGQLIVEGVRVRPPLHASARAALVEMNYGPFRRALALPDDADGDGIRATYEAGILQIHVPRAPRPAPRRVEIQSS